MPEKLTLSDMQLLALDRGGKCLSEVYINANNKLTWQCMDGHAWEATPNDVKNKKSWCLFCLKGKKGFNLRRTIQDMKEIAEAKGGRCLSDIYINNRTKLRWQCSNGHQWDTIPDVIISGSWCPYCSDRVKLTLEEMKLIAKERGGQCLSSEYIDSKTHLRWRCFEGHEWGSTPNSIKRGSWCPRCSGHTPITIEDLQVVAAAKGGQFLSANYVDSKTKVKWQCADGHQWDAVSGSVKQGSWCPECAKQTYGASKRLTIEEMKEIALKRGGECLSDTYVNSQTYLRWRCVDGHEWDAKPNIIKYGAWCPTCANSKFYNEEKCRFILEALFRAKFPKKKRFIEKRYELDGYCHSLKLAFEYQGEQHYSPEWAFFKPGDFERQKQRDLIKKEACIAMYIKLIEIPHYVFKTDEELVAYICAELINLGINTKLSPVDMEPFYTLVISALSDLKTYASTKGGKCLSTTYINANSPVLWECAEGHQWEAASNNIKNKGQWCPVCANRVPLGIETMHNLAASRGGKCLSKDYVSTFSKLIWECAEGHRWEAISSNIARDHWCPYCAGKVKGTIEEMQELAAIKGGKCSSKTYINKKKKLMWECAEGHSWETIPEVIKRGSWCPTCSGKTKGSIEEMHQIAETRGGKCLSETYVNTDTKIKWQCAELHIWENTPYRIKKGYWCSICRKKTGD